MSCVHRLDKRLWPSTDGNQCWPTWGSGKKDDQKKHRLGNGIGKLKTSDQTRPGWANPLQATLLSESQLQKLISQPVINIKFGWQPKKGHNDSESQFKLETTVAPSWISIHFIFSPFFNYCHIKKKQRILSLWLWLFFFFFIKWHTYFRFRSNLCLFLLSLLCFFFAPASVYNTCLIFGPKPSNPFGHAQLEAQT